MSNLDVATRLRDLGESYGYRAKALSDSLESYARSFSPESRMRRDALRRTLQRMAKELAAAALRILRSRANYARHVAALRRATEDEDFGSILVEVMRISVALHRQQVKNVAAIRGDSAAAGKRVKGPTAQAAVPSPGRLKRMIRREVKAAIPVENNTADQPVQELVTLAQVAALTGIKKRTLERYLHDGKLPIANFPGGEGKASKWFWSTIGPAMESVCDRKLPKRFPGSQII